MKNINIPLTKQGIQNFKNKIDNLISEIPKVNEEILSELADLGQNEIEKNKASTIYTDGNDDYTIFKEKNNNGYKVGARGSQVLYDEFGTGTEGLNKPHELKNNFNLNEYNSGKTIRKASINIKPETGILPGELYWTYKNKNGETIYTQGIPAGKEVFNAEQTVKKEKAKIIKRKVGEVLSKL